MLLCVGGVESDLDGPNGGENLVSWWLNRLLKLSTIIFAAACFRGKKLLYDAGLPSEELQTSEGAEAGPHSPRTRGVNSLLLFTFHSY